MHVGLDMSGNNDTLISSLKVKTPRQRKGWVQRLIIRGMNGKGSKKRRFEFDGEGHKARLTQKRRRIGRVGWVKQQHKEMRQPGLRAFLRPEEHYIPSEDSSLEHTNRSHKHATTTLGNFKPTGYSYEDKTSHTEMPKVDQSCTHSTYDTLHNSKASPPDEPPDNEATIQLLPDELVDKVLGRLPLTSVLRFRSVCRRWQSRLSPEGLRNIFPRNATPLAWMACPALFMSGNSKRQCAFYDESLRKWSCVLLDFLPDPACHFLAANGGLLCLCFSGMNSSLFICNPITKSWRALPSFNHPRCRAGSMIVHMLVHPETGAYKVILIGHPTCITTAPPAMTEVFDSETGSWTTLATVPSMGCTMAPSVVLRNGVLYCLTELPAGLLAFNLARKVWRRLEIKSHFRVLLLFEHRGHILLVARMSARVTRLGIWRLRETFPRVWLKVAIMPPDYGNYFLKSGKLQCFGHGDFVCFASPRRPQWLLYDLAKRSWSWGLPMCGLDQDNYNRWFFYEPRLDIQA
ncbi:unnamed protein product [Calypogeia fissa]